MRFHIRVIVYLLAAAPLGAQWRALGPFGGPAAVVQADPHRSDVVIAATSNALLFRSTDGGYFWKPLPFPAQLQGTLHAFVIDPNARDVFYAGLTSDWPDYRGVYRTRDGGQTWQLLKGLGNKEVWSIALWPEDSRVMAAGTGDGVYLSRDGGENWRRISPAENRELQPVVSLAFDPANSNVIYAGTTHLPWKTANGGGAWYSIHRGMADDSDIFSIEVERKRTAYVYASACSGIYRSQNSGGQWRKLTGAQGASYRTYFVAQDPRYAGVLYAGTNHGLTRSDNGGATWRQLSTNATRWITFDTFHPWRVFVVTDDGIFRSNDRGKTFQAASDGFCNRYLPGLAAADNSIYTAADGSIFQLPNGMGPWRKVVPVSKVQAFAIATAPGNSQLLYAAGYRALLASADGGRTWTSLPAPAPDSRITALLALPGRLLAGTDAGLFHSGNGGKSWNAAGLPVAKPAIRAFARVDRESVAAITSFGLFFSRDGVNWKSAGVVQGNPEILGVASAGGGTLFAATSRGLVRSDDSGSSWHAAGGSLDGNTVSAVAAHPARLGVVFAAQYGNIYVSNDNGRTWRRIPTEGLLMTTIRELQLLPGTPDRLYALTKGQGVFGLPLEARASIFSTAP